MLTARYGPVAALVLGCNTAPTGTSGMANGNAHPSELRSPEKAVTTPDVVAKAEELLRENANAAIGTTIPFRLNGRGHVARIEEHDNPEREPGRPFGKHKGVTVYLTD